MTPEPVSTDEGQKTAEEDRERSSTPAQSHQAGEEEEEQRGEEGRVGGEWMDVMQEPVQPPPQMELEVSIQLNLSNQDTILAVMYS